MDGLPKFANVQNEPRRMTETPLDLGPNGMSLDLLRAVYRNDQLPLVTRMRAAIAALPFESPKLAVTAMVSEQDFATLLDQRLKRMEAMRADEAKAQPVEVKPSMQRIA
jgi:TATA-box binding protein (TBP) (component of TFIID and TFIIIB)